MTTSASVNGVDCRKLFGTIEAIRANPSAANFQFRLSNQWVHGGESRSCVENYRGANDETRHARPFFLMSGEPAVLPSDDKAPGKAPTPVEYLLHALAGCMTTSLAYYAAAQGIRLRSVGARLEGDLDVRGFLGVSPQVRRGFGTIRMAFTIDADCSETRKKELLAMARMHSPVFDMLANGLPVMCALVSGASEAKAA